MGSNGQEIPTIASPRVIVDNDAHVSCYCTVLTDITELREAWKLIRIREDDLKLKSLKLDELNIAMKVLLKERDEYRAQIEEKILTNVRHLFDPLLERMKVSGLNRQQEMLLDLLESSTKDLLSSFSLQLTSASLGLSSMEIQVANLLREGRSTKEIAKTLNLSPRTVDSHRLNIRKKIGIRHKTENLSNHLLSLK
jgi:DNA-binding NarL/FixJ family response regulator